MSLVANPVISHERGKDNVKTRNKYEFKTFMNSNTVYTIYKRYYMYIKLSNVDLPIKRVPRTVYAHRTKQW